MPWIEAELIGLSWFDFWPFFIKRDMKWISNLFRIVQKQIPEWLRIALIRTDWIPIRMNPRWKLNRIDFQAICIKHDSKWFSDWFGIILNVSETEDSRIPVEPNQSKTNIKTLKIWMLNYKCDWKNRKVVCKCCCYTWTEVGDLFERNWNYTTNVYYLRICISLFSAARHALK